MNVIVTDAGFGPDDWTRGFVPPANLAANDCGPVVGLDLPSDLPPDTLPSLAARLDGIALIRVNFPSFADGRGFTIVRQLRLLGYRGRLRARGHVISDQYAMARRAGFDEVEISPELARRQPEAHWRFRADWTAYDYQSRVKG